MLAYLDPGSGSMWVSAAAAGAAGVGVVVRSAFGRFRRERARTGGTVMQEPPDIATDAEHPVP